MTWTRPKTHSLSPGSWAFVWTAELESQWDGSLLHVNSCCHLCTDYITDFYCPKSSEEMVASWYLDLLKLAMIKLRLEIRRRFPSIWAKRFWNSLPIGAIGGKINSFWWHSINLWKEWYDVVPAIRGDWARRLERFFQFSLFMFLLDAMLWSPSI